MENFVGEAALRVEKFPCIVCASETNSIEELHDHQRRFHTSEELSLSVICLVHYMCVKNENSGFDVASKYAMLHNNNANTYHIPQTHDPDIFLTKNRTAGVPELVHETQTSSRCFPNLEQRDWEIELGQVLEISDETFSKCVDEICGDLELIKRPAPAKRRVRQIPGNKTDEKTNGTGRFKRNFPPTIHKRLRASKTSAKALASRRFEETMPMNYDCEKKNFDSLDENKDFKGNGGIPVLEKPSAINYKREMKMMPVLESNFCIEEKPQGDDIQLKQKTEGKA